MTMRHDSRRASRAEHHPLPSPTMVTEVERMRRAADQSTRLRAPRVRMRHPASRLQAGAAAASTERRASRIRTPTRVPLSAACTARLTRRASARAPVRTPRGTPASGFSHAYRRASSSERAFQRSICASGSGGQRVDGRGPGGELHAAHQASVGRALDHPGDAGQPRAQDREAGRHVGEQLRGGGPPLVLVPPAQRDQADIVGRRRLYGGLGCARGDEPHAFLQSQFARSSAAGASPRWFAPWKVSVDVPRRSWPWRARAPPPVGRAGGPPGTAAAGAVGWAPARCDDLPGMLSRTTGRRRSSVRRTAPCSSPRTSRRP